RPTSNGNARMHDHPIREFPDNRLLNQDIDWACLAAGVASKPLLSLSRSLTGHSRCLHTARRLGP
ncbi:hypothetical protein, partial [Hoeflea alexandrii]|uniref:hypothetical protein n=1 Tax=Hoeflea alexandrii TaxID=288436 RepID=UPI0022AE78D8